MASLDQILTHKFNPESLKSLSEKVAEESGEKWVTTDSIQRYNATLDLKLNVLNKIIRFLFVEHPYIGFFCFLITPPIILLPIAIGAYGTVNYILLGFGMFIGFVVGSFIFPNLVTSCKVCGAIKKCNRIFTHCLEYEDHTEERFSNGVKYKYLVRLETVFCVYECEKCKGRKIEVLKQKREKRL